MTHFAFFASDVHTQDFWVGEGYPAGKKIVYNYPETETTPSIFLKEL
jgi:hypothetical protein